LWSIVCERSVRTGCDGGDCSNFNMGGTALFGTFGVSGKSGICSLLRRLARGGTDTVLGFACWLFREVMSMEGAGPTTGLPKWLPECQWFVKNFIVWFMLSIDTDERGDGTGEWWPGEDPEDAKDGGDIE
jgi:hypothetical protein